MKSEESLLTQLRQWAEHELRVAGPHVVLGDEEAAEENAAAPTPEVAAAETEAAETEAQRGGNTAPAAGPSPEASASEAESETARQSETAPHADAPDPDDMPSTNLFGDALSPDADPSLSPYDRVAALIPDGHPIKEMETLDEVRDWAQNTILVPIDEQRQNVVFGTGDPNAGLMIVGEAPGADEDRTGEPFVGRAGQLLNKILEAINFSRDEVYICNILKSRPPGNRDPLAEETAAHIPLLYKQIELVRPKIILAVGKTSGNGLLGKRSSLGSLRGQFHDYHGIPFMVTYHPAALLRNPQWKRPTWEDVKLLRTRYDQMMDGQSE
jgi:DNA polymerase